MDLIAPLVLWGALYPPIKVSEVLTPEPQNVTLRGKSLYRGNHITRSWCGRPSGLAGKELAQEFEL